MKDLFAPYKMALKLKLKGFDEACFKYYCEKPNGEVYLTEFNIIHKNTSLKLKSNVITYIDFCTAPLYQQVVDWLREKHNIEVFSQIHLSASHTSRYFPHLYRKVKTEYGYEWKDDVFYNKAKTYNYYEALNKAIEEALKLI